MGHGRGGPHGDELDHHQPAGGLVRVADEGVDSRGLLGGQLSQHRGGVSVIEIPEDVRLGVGRELVQDVGGVGRAQVLDHVGGLGPRQHLDEIGGLLGTERAQDGAPLFGVQVRERAGGLAGAEGPGERDEPFSVGALRALEQALPGGRAHPSTIRPTCTMASP